MSHLIVDIEKTTTDELETLYEPRGVDKGRRPLNISEKVLRVSSDRLVLVGSDHTKEDFVTAFADAVHWYRQKFNDDHPFTFRYFAGEHEASVKEMLWTLKSALKSSVPIEIWEGNEPATLSQPKFKSNSKERANKLAEQGNHKCPPLAVSIQQRIGADNFSWYRTLASKRYSGRIDGLEVCFIEQDEKSGAVKIGKQGKNGAISCERKVFLGLSGNRESVEFDESNLDEAIKLLKKLADERRSGVELSKCQPEHRLEAMILSRRLPVVLDGKKLEPVISMDGLPFQFPTQWSSTGSNRYVDALMRNSNVPWVIEIKDSGSAGQYLRHSVVQAVLYREFIRKAEKLHPWFKNRHLEADKCEAAVAFPTLKASNKAELEHVKDLANLFGVYVVELPEPLHTASPHSTS